MTREHPRRRHGFYVMGGGPVPEPADTPLDALMDGPPPDGDAVAAAVEWDQAAAAEPYQLDVTRSLDDTTRMGNSLSAAVRLELLLGSMREEAQDRRPTDPVDGAELDPVDLLPIPAECSCAPDQCSEGNGECRLCDTMDGELPCPVADGGEDDGDQLAAPVPYPANGPHWQALQAEAATPWSTVADLQALVAPLVYAAPAPVVTEHLTHTIAEEAPDFGAVAMTPAQAVSFAGAPSRVMNWTSRHDVKSLEFGVRARLRAPAPLVDRDWPHGPILDQGTAPPLSLHDASGCTGHAGVNAANILETVHDHRQADEWLDGADAMRLYERAQELDEVPGEAYPGTSILAVMKAGQELGLWGTYLWAFGTRDVAQALLQVGPVVIGVPWLSGMADPGPDGIVTVTGQDAGGHALCLHAIRMKVGGRAGPWFGALQTWGESVGDHGVIWIHHKDLAQLLHGRGEAAIPLAEVES